ncbi:MAG: condensation domain-containing protein, partial [Nocardiaceae bacterium]|nr:condensation domain-containing protein [Nocardiaceae bacterium]
MDSAEPAERPESRSAESFGSRFPLSEAQRALWFAQQLVPDVPLFIAQYVDIEGPLDIDELRSANIRAAGEFQSPGVQIVTVDGEPQQYIEPVRDRSIRLIDLRAERDSIGAARQWMRREMATPIDLSSDRLVETVILQVGDRHFLWYSRSHHIALDGYAAATMLYRIADLYTAAIEGGELDPPGAADLHALLEIDERYRGSSRHDTDREYWAGKLSGVHGISLTESVAPAVAESRLASGSLSARTVHALERAEGAESSSASAAARIIAAFAHYLSRMTDRRDVLVNIPVSARTTALLRRSGGVTVNLLPLPLEIADDDTVASLSDRVQLELVAALRHQRCSRTDIVRDTGADTSGPIVNVMFFHPEIVMGDLRTEFHILTSGPVDDLLVNVYQSGTPVRTFVDFRANPHRYGADEQHTYHRLFVDLLEEFVAADPRTPLVDLRSAAAPPAGRPAAATPTPAETGTVDESSTVTAPSEPEPEPEVESEIERAIAGVFADVLAAGRPVGPEDSFFDLGGDSLVATKVVARVNATLRAAVTVRDLFERPTVRRLAAYVESSLDADGTWARAAVPAAPTRHDRPDRLPLSAAQQRMWFVDQLDTTSPVYNIPFAVTLTGALDRDSLQAALADVVERHEALRTIYPCDADGPHQVVVAAQDAVPDLGPVDVDRDGVWDAVRAEAAAGFDVREQLPLRIKLFRTGSDEYVLSVVAHHIAADGQSVVPLARDVMVAYAARREGRAPDWDPLPLQYADYALWQREMLGDPDDPGSVTARGLRYWTARLDDAPPVVALPLDRPRPPVMSPAGDAVRFAIAPDVHRRLVDLARARDCTLFMVLHTAFAVLLSRLGAGRDIVIGTPVAGRTAA